MITGKIQTLYSGINDKEALFPRTKIKAISDDDGIGLTNILYNKQDKPSQLVVSLITSDWLDLKQAININEITENNIVIVAPTPNSYSAYCEAGIYCSNQVNGILTFTCSKVPQSDLEVNILILN